MVMKVGNAHYYLLDDIFIRFDSKLYRYIVCITMCTNCAILVENLFCLVLKETYL